MHRLLCLCPSTWHPNLWMITETEGQVESKYRVSHMATSLLTNMRSIGQRERINEFMYQDQWCHMAQELSSDDPCMTEAVHAQSFSRKTKQVIISRNLSLTSKRLDTSQVTMTARTQDQFDSLQSYFCSTFGVAIRKRSPSLRAAKMGMGTSKL